MDLVVFIETIDELQIVYNYMCKQFNKRDIHWVSQYFKRPELDPLYIKLDMTACHQPVWPYMTKQDVYNDYFSDCILVPIDFCLYPENYPELFI